MLGRTVRFVATSHLRADGRLLASVAQGNHARHRSVTVTRCQALQPQTDDDTASEAASTCPVVPVLDSICFIGAGQMGEALIRGFAVSGVSSTQRLSAASRSASRRQYLSDMGLASVHGDILQHTNAAAACSSDVLVLAVKPIFMGPVMESLAQHVRPEHLVISIAAGVTLQTLEAALPAGTRVVRVMPNTPAVIRQAASAYSLGKHATSADALTTHQLMSSIGETLLVEERLMDAVTGLSGSGPAFTFLMIEALADGGVAAGLPRKEALALAAQTVSGAAQMVLKSTSHPAQLRDSVTSPAGTTAAGLLALEECGARAAFIKAVKAAAQRSAELGRSG